MQIESLSKRKIEEVIVEKNKPLPTDWVRGVLIFQIWFLKYTHIPTYQFLKTGKKEDCLRENKR